MNVRDRLINKELQHLGQVIQIVSFELTILQDFMKENFGAKYEAFRNGYGQPEEDTTTGATVAATGSKKGSAEQKLKATARKSTCHAESKRQGSSSDGGDKQQSTEGGGDVEEGVDLVEANTVDDDWNQSWLSGSGMDAENADDVNMSSDDDGGMEDTEMGGDSDDELPEGAEVIDYVDLEASSARGRNRRAIWRKFIVIKLPNGKYLPKCPKCKKYVSNKSVRLENHYKNCIKGERRTVATVGTANSSVANEIVKKKAMEYVEVDKKNGDLEEMERKSGRRLDPVWGYFTVHRDSVTGKKITTCKTCKMPVSSKADRVRKHFVMCKELEKESVKGTSIVSGHDGT